MRVNEIMKKAVAIEGDTTIKNAAKIMSERSIGSIILLKKDKIQGIITERDILKNISKPTKKVSSIMTKDVFTINENESIDNAISVMAEKKIKRLPVLDNNKLVGIVTATDILANADVVNENFLFD